MSSPVEGDIFSKGTKKQITFVWGSNLAALTNLAGKLVNMTTGNNFAYNNSDISVADNGTGTIQITANLSETGRYVAQFAANNATLKEYSPEYGFKVVDPILTGL